MEAKFKVRIKNLDFEIEIESTDRNFVEAKLRDYALINLESPNLSKSIEPKAQIGGTLAKFLKDNDATVNQTKKFLGAAIYLSSKGKSSIKTSDVTAALRDAGQTKLRNPSENLNQNVKKGFLEKIIGNEFMVTVHGKDAFGLSEY